MKYNSIQEEIVETEDSWSDDCECSGLGDNTMSKIDSNKHLKEETPSSTNQTEDGIFDDGNPYMSKFFNLKKLQSETNPRRFSANVDVEKSDDTDYDWLMNSGEFTGNISDGQTTQNFINQISGFYEEMSARVKLLKNSPVLKRAENIDRLLKAQLAEHFFEENPDHHLARIQSAKEAKTRFRSPRSTSKYKKYLETIKKLDAEIADRNAVLEEARAERMAAQEEMCNEIYNSNMFRDKHTQLFLDMCSFERSSRLGDNQTDAAVTAKPAENSGDVKHSPCIKKPAGKDFISRNIELAKQGIMATCSLTDEEKEKLENLLSDIDFSNVAVENSNENKEESPESSDNEHDEKNQECNEFSITSEHKCKIDSINQRLVEFDKKYETVATEQTNPILDPKKWTEFLLEHNLKDINNKLKEIEDSFEKDEAAKQNEASGTRESLEGDADTESTQLNEEDSCSEDSVSNVIQVSEASSEI